MKKSVALGIFVISLVLVLSLSFVSAGFFGDLWNKITGEVVTKTTPGTQGTCTDTDNGANRFLQGTINGTFGTNSDYCLTNGVIGDPGTQVNEFYCKGDGIGSIVYDCDYGCVEGACLLEALPEEEIKENFLCNETDGGQDYFNKGVTENFDGSFEDFCSEAAAIHALPTELNEYYCFGEEVAEETVDCEFGCLFGECLEEAVSPDACLDIDKSNDPFVLGRVYKLDEVKTDFCESENDLIQYYCAGGGVIGSLATICEGGCENGVCLEGGTSSSGNECYDTDPFDDIHKFGTVVVPGESSSIDACLPSFNGGPISVKQYSCGSEGELQESISSCGSECKDADGNYRECTCSSGVCEEPVYSCQDSDGMNSFVKGERTIDGGETYDEDFCLSEYEVKEYFCWNPPEYTSGGNPGEVIQDCRWLDENGEPALTIQNPDNYCDGGVCVLSGQQDNLQKPEKTNTFSKGMEIEGGQQNNLFFRVRNFFRNIF